MSITKLEDVFDDCFDIATTRAHPYASDFTSGSRLWENLKPHILGFVREQSIAFARWKDIHGWDINPDTGGNYTTEQLFDLFIKTYNADATTK